VADNRQDSARFAWQLEPQIQIDLECLSGHRKQIMSQGNGRMKSGLSAGNCGLAKSWPTNHMQRQWKMPKMPKKKWGFWGGG